MISLHKNQLAIWILLYTLNYTTSFEYGIIWTNLNNKQLCGVPSSAPWKAWHRLYYDNSNEIIGLKQLPYINGPRHGKVNITNFGNYETINSKHETDPLRHDDLDQSIENTKGNVLLSSRRETFSLIGYDEEIYKIMQKFTMSGQTGSILIYFYLCQNHKYSNIGLLRTTPRILNLILSKYNYFHCVNSNHIMIPRENNLFYADECLKDCDKLVTNINLKNNDSMESYVDYFANNCLNGKDNHQNNIAMNNGNNFNTNDSPAINHLQLPQNNYKIKANPKKILLHDLENINDRVAYLENNLNENNKNNYADILNSDVVNKFLTDKNKNSIGKNYSEKPSPIRDNAQNVRSRLYSNSIPVQEFMSHPSHLESNEFKFKLHNNDNNFETIKNNVDIQTTNTSPAKNLNNAIILEGNFIKENLNTPEIDYDPSSNNKIDTYTSYGKNKILKQIYNTKDDHRVVDNIPYNINYKEDQNGQLVFPYKSTGSEFFDTALANNQVEYLPSHELLKLKSLFPDQYLNKPLIAEANYSIPKTLAYASIKPDTNIHNISSAGPTNKNLIHLNYVEPRLFAANAQTFGSKTLNSNPYLQYTINPETSDNIMQRYNFVEPNETKPFIDANTAIPYELITNDVSKMNQHKLPYNRPDFTTLRYMNTPTVLQRPGFYAQRELPNLKSMPSEGLNSNTFTQNSPVSISNSNNILQTLPSLAYKKHAQVINNGLPESKSKYLPTVDGMIHSLQTPFSAKYDESSPRHTNKENTSSVQLTQWKPVSLTKDFIEPTFPYNVVNHKNKVTPFVTSSQVVYQTIPKRNDVIPLDVEYTTSKIPTFYDNHKPDKVISVLPRTGSKNYKISVEISKLPFKKTLSPKKLNVIPPTYESLLHKKAPTWVQKYQPVDGFPGQNANQNLFTKNFKSDDNQEREPIIDLSKATMGIPQYIVFNAPNAKTAKYYCPSYRYPSFLNMQNDNNSPTTTTTSSASRNTTTNSQHSLITEPQDKNNKEQSISNGIASPCHFPPLSQTSNTYKSQFSEELPHQEAGSDTTEPQNKSNEEQSISNGIASPCYLPPLSQTSKTYEPQISEELTYYQETIPRKNNHRNFKNLPLASSTSYKNPSLYVPNDFNNVSPNPQLATLSTATNHPSTVVVQNSPAVNFAQPLKILDEKEYFKSPNIEYYNPTSKVKAKPFIKPVTPRVEFLPPKRTNIDLLNALYFPSKINTICSNTAFGETPKLSDIDDTNNNLASVETPKVPPRMSLNRDKIKIKNNTPSTRIDQHTPSWIKKYYHYPLQAPYDLPIQINEQNNFEKPAIPKQESNNIHEKEPLVDLSNQINQPCPNENTGKYYSPLQRNPSFTDKPYSMIPKPNCNRCNIHQPLHQTSQNQYFPVIESHKETKLGQNRIAKSYDFPMSQILQSYKPQSLEVPKLSKQIDKLIPQSKTKVTEFEPQHQPNFQNVNFSQANGSSCRKPPLNPYNLKSMLRNVQQAKVPTAANQQSNLNLKQAGNIKELHDNNNLYFQQNGQGLLNLANKDPVSSTLYIHKHPPFEYTNPMWTILPQTLSNNSLDPKQQIKFTPMENSLEQTKRYKNPCHASGEGYKIQNPKLNYVKPFDYEVNAYYPKISNQKGLQPCVSNTAEFYDEFILKPHTTSPQTIPTNLALEPTRFSSPKKLSTQTFNHDLGTAEYFPTLLPAQIKYYTPLLTHNAIPMKQPLMCHGNNNKINYYTKSINPNSIRKTIFTPNHQHTISVEEPTPTKSFTKLSTLNEHLYSLNKLEPSQFNEMPSQLMSAQKKSEHPINYSNKNINFINDIKEQTHSESAHVPFEIKYFKFNFTEKHNKWPAKYLKSYTAPMGYFGTALPCPIKSSPVFDQSSIKSTTALPFVTPAIVSKKYRPQKSLTSYQALVKLSSIAPTEKRKYNTWPAKYSQNLSTPRPIPSPSNPFVLTNIGKTAHPSIQDRLTKNKPQPKIKFIQEPFSFQQNSHYSSPISRNQERNINQVNNIVENYIAKPVPFIHGESRTGGDKYHNIRNDLPCSLLSVPMNSYSPSSSIISQKSWIRKPYPKSTFNSKTPLIKITPSHKTQLKLYKYTPFEDIKDSDDSHRKPTSGEAPVINITPFLKTQTNPYKYTRTFKDLNDSGVNQRIPASAETSIINITPSLKMQPNSYKYTPTFKDLKDSDGNYRIPTSTAAPIINITPSFKTRPNPYKYTPFKDLKDSGGNHRILTSAVTPIINIAPSLKTQSNPYKYTPTYFKDQKDGGGNFIIPTSTINMTPYKYTPFKDRKDSGDNYRIQTSAKSPIINIAPSHKTRPNQYTPLEDLKDIGANITLHLRTRSNPHYTYTPSFKDLKYSGGNHRDPTSAVTPVINIAPSLRAQSNQYENTPTFKYLKDSEGKYRICTPAETPISKITPSIDLSRYIPLFKESKGSAGNNRIGNLMNTATYPFEPYSPYPAIFYAPTPNIKPRKLLPTTVQPIQLKSKSNIADFELQKPKLHEKPVAYSAPLYKIVNGNIIGNTGNNTKHTTPEDKTPCNVFNSYKSKKFKMYDLKKPTKAAYFSQNRPYNVRNSLNITNDKINPLSSSQTPAVFWAPLNNLSPPQTVISKGTLRNGNVVPRLTENTSNLYETNTPLPKVLGSSYNIPQDNVDALTLNQPCIAVPPTIQSAGKILPLKQSPIQFVDNLFKNVAVHKNDDPVQNILYSYPMQGNQHNTKEFTDLRDNYVKPFKCTTCDCKVCERNPTILDQIMEQLYAYSKTLPDKFYESRAGFTNGKISIPFRDMGLAKYEVTKPNEYVVKTEIPGLFIKAWGSRIKIVRPRLVLDVKEYEGYNFMPVIKNHYYRPEFAQNVAKDIVTRLYGEPIVIDGMYSPTSPYAVIDDINNALVNDGKAYILWPTLCNCGCMKSGCKCCFRS